MDLGMFLAFVSQVTATPLFLTVHSGDVSTAHHKLVFVE